jgi:hypothetical protein
MVAALIIWWIAIGGLALGVCGAVLWLKILRRAQATEERLTRIEVAAKIAREREAQRPKLRAFMEQEVKVRWYLTIQNVGEGSASDCTVSINGSSLEQSLVVEDGSLNLAALSVVGGHDLVRIPLKTAARPSRLRVELSWSDASGELGLYKAELTALGQAPDVN